MTRSKAHILGQEREVGEAQAQMEEIEVEGDNTEDEIYWFTLGPKDIPQSSS